MSKAVPYLSFSSALKNAISGISLNKKDWSDYPKYLIVKSRNVPCSNVTKSICFKVIQSISMVQVCLSQFWLWYICGISVDLWCCLHPLNKPAAGHELLPCSSDGPSTGQVAQSRSYGSFLNCQSINLSRQPEIINLSLQMLCCRQFWLRSPFCTGH